MPRDRFGREIDYLRISVIDHCNLRCVYCMPLRGLSFVPSPELLTAEEIEAVVRAAVAVGFHKIRLTGGEPTLRADLVDITRRIAGVPGVLDLAMTTNGILLPRLAQPLREAGLRRLNLHVDTLHPERLKKLMRFATVEEVEAGIAAAVEAGLVPIKINCTVTRDYNDTDVVDLARRARDDGWHVRFIELMPLGGGETAHVALSQFVPTIETRRRIETELGPLAPLPRENPSDEAVNYRFAGGGDGIVGFVSPVSEPYCGACNRMRLTADGKFHLCLLSDDELDVKHALRSGQGEPAVQAILLKAVGAKPTGHRLDEGVSTRARSMFQIGGSAARLPPRFPRRARASPALHLALPNCSRGSMGSGEDVGHGAEFGLKAALELLEAVPQGLAVLDPAGRIAWANLAFEKLHADDARTTFVGRALADLYGAAEGARLERRGVAAARAGGQWCGEAEGRAQDGAALPLELQFAPLAGGRVALAARDLSEQRSEIERVSGLVYRDPLTGLPNRRLFEDRLAIALAQAHRYRHRLAVIFADVDRFKLVNDTLGHAAGDALLQAVAQRLADAVREGDTVARIAGDEFTLILPGIHYAEDLAAISRKLQDAMRQPYVLDGHDVRVTLSGGIALYPEDGEAAEALLRAADAAMYRAKERGRDNFQLFSRAMAEKTVERRALEASLREAVARQEMRLHYQPCLELASGRVIGVEALLRWSRPELGLLLPKDFIALADFTGAMLSVGSWVLTTACRQAREWRRAAPELRMMVNVSTYELQQEGFVGQVREALRTSGLEPDALHLEVPEGYAMQDVNRAVKTFGELRALGVHLAIDGFGSGFSSLAQLRRLPVDALKIDLSFVRGATTDADDASVVTAVIAVAHSLGMRVAAQGVETEAQVALLRSLGCDFVQGYLWSPAVPAEECAPFVTGKPLAGGLS